MRPTLSHRLAGGRRPRSGRTLTGPSLLLSLLAVAPTAAARPSTTCLNDTNCTALGKVCEDGTCVRPGMRNPLEALQYEYPDRRPLRRDDELFWIGEGSSPIKGFAFRPTGAFLSPGDLSGEVVSAASGRVLGTANEQAAIVYGEGAFASSKSTPGDRLLVVHDLLDADDRGFAGFGARPLAIVKFAANPFNPNIAVAVGDLDDIQTPYPANEYHDEVVLAYQVNNQLQLRVMSFEKVEPGTGTVGTATKDFVLAIPTGSITLPTTGTPSHIALAIGDVVPDANNQREVAVAAYNAGGSVDTNKVIIRVYRLMTNPDGSRSLVAGNPPTGSGTKIAVAEPNLAFALQAGLFEVGWGSSAQERSLVFANINSSGDRFRIRSYRQVISADTWSWWSEPEAYYGVINSGTLAGGTNVRALPNSRLILTKGTFPATTQSRGLDQACAFYDTNYGPVMQIIRFGGNPGGAASGPLYDPDKLIWPKQGTLDNRSATTQPTRSYGIAGGFVDYRYERMFDGLDSNINRARLMVSDPDEGTPLKYIYVSSAGDYLTGTGNVLDDNGQQIFEPMQLLLAADVDGDSAYAYAHVNGTVDIFYGLGTHYAFSEVQSLDTVLEEPPKHLDWIPDPSDFNYGMLNVSQLDDFKVSLETSMGHNETLEQSTETAQEFSESESLAVSGSVKADAPWATAEVHAGSKNALDTLHQSTTGYFITGTSSVDVTTTTQTERDDQLYVESQTFDVWRVPAMGLQSVDDQGTVLPPDQQPVNPTFEASFPGKPINVSTAGRTTDAYQPPHINGNLLSYPSYSQSWEPDDIGPFVEWRDTNHDGVPDTPSNNQPAPGIPLYSVSNTAGGSSAHVTCTYGTTDTATTHMGNSDTYAESTEFTAGGEVSASYGVASAEATIDYTYSSKDQDTIAHATNSQNFSSVETAVGLDLVSAIPSGQSYSFISTWYFTPGGAMKVAHGVKTAGSGGTFWNNNYGPADPALDLPFRFQYDSMAGAWTLNTDPSTRARMKGLFIQDQSFNDYFIPPYAGDQVVLTARVYNLSKNTDATNVRVRFQLQEVATDSMGVHEIGPRFTAGNFVVPTIPKHGGAELPGREPGAPNNSVLASVVWDTTGFGPAPGQVLRDWRVYVILDPTNTIPNEKHELVDRYNDPLGTTPLGALEKGQNNTGWAPVSIGAPLDQTLALTIGEAPDVFVPAGGIELIDPASGRGKAGFAEVRKGEKQKLRVRIQATGVKPRVGTLTVLAKGSDGIERAVAMRRVWGVDPRNDRIEFVDWTPEKAGHYTLTAHYSEPANDRRTGNSDGTLEVRVTAP